MTGGLPDFNNQTWIENGGPQKWCYQNPDSQLCEHVPATYEYDIDLAANAFFCAFFSLSIIAFVVTWIFTRTGTAFNVALILGCLCEVLGYAGRIMGYVNPWDGNGFMMQICCLTIGPAFMAAGIYLCLRRIVCAYGQENSIVPAEYYTRIVS